MNFVFVTDLFMCAVQELLYSRSQLVKNTLFYSMSCNAESNEY